MRRVAGCRGLDRDVDERTPVGAGAGRAQVLGHHDGGDVGDRFGQAVGRVDAGERVERVVGDEFARLVRARSRCARRTARAPVPARRRTRLARQVEADRDRVARRSARTASCARAAARGSASRRRSPSIVSGSSPVFSKRTTRRCPTTSSRPCWIAHGESRGRDGRRRAGRRRGAGGEGERRGGEGGDEREQADAARTRHPGRHRVTAPRRRAGVRRASGEGRPVAPRPPRSRARRGRRARRRRPACRRRRPGAARC